MGEVFRISGISIYTLGLVVVVSYLFGAFVYYKKAIEAHIEEVIVLDTIVICAFWAIMLGRVSFVVLNFSQFFKHLSRIFLLVDYPGVERWGVFLGIFLGLYLVLRKKKMKLIDFLDLITLGFFVSSSFFWIGLNFINFYWQNLVLGFYYFLIFGFLWKLERTYRLISWYRAGKAFAKSGFVLGFGLAALGVGFGLEKLLFVSMFWQNMLVSIGFLFSGLALVYIRSGRILVDDIKVINIWKKKIKK